MGNIFCLTGKSASGKDTLYRAILATGRPELLAVVPCTTRPRREGEVDGREYQFVDEQTFQAYQAAGRVLEARSYHTTQGLWTYFTLDFPVEADKNYLLITTLTGVRAFLDRYGAGVVHTVCLQAEDRVRLLRQIDRESRQPAPDFCEVCRRFLADASDFSEAELKKIPHLHRINTLLPEEQCLAEWEQIYAAVI